MSCDKKDSDEVGKGRRSAEAHNTNRINDTMINVCTTDGCVYHSNYLNTSHRHDITTASSYGDDLSDM